MPTKKTAPSSAKTAKSAPVQLWYGQNQSLLAVELRKWIDLFRAKYPEAEVKRFEYSQVDESELAAALHQAAYGGSLLGKKTFIILINALVAEAKSELGELIKTICTSPSPESVVLLVETGKIAWSKGLPKEIKKLAEAGKISLREFVNLSQVEIERWLQARIREPGGKLAPTAARLLAQKLDNDFFALANEIDKLVAYCAGEEIRAAEVDLLVKPKLQEDVFAFIDAVGKRDVSAAQATLARQFDQGVSPQSLIGMLAWQVRVLALVRQALDGSKPKANSRELAGELGLHPFVVTKTLQQIPYYSAERIAWLYGELANLDVKLKTTPTDPQVLFGLFLSKLSTLKPVGQGVVSSQ